jgi:hypothetical protein
MNLPVSQPQSLDTLSCILLESQADGQVVAWVTDTEPPYNVRIPMES